MSFNRIIVVAPTRSTCYNLWDLLRRVTLPETQLTRECGSEINAAVIDLPKGGFSIVSDTGTGKSVSIQHIACKVLQKDNLTVSMITAEQSRKDVSQSDVIVLTPGMAIHLAKQGEFTKNDLIVFDEVHETSEHLELIMALIKRLSLTVVWMSATVDPLVYQSYFGTQRVITCDLTDTKLQAKSINHGNLPIRQWLEANLESIGQNKRGMVIFVSTRAEAEQLATSYNGQYGVKFDFYHGGASSEELAPYLSGEQTPPFVVVMTPAGASSLNIAGLNTVAIVDEHYVKVVRDGRYRQVLAPLDSSTLKQMMGRVDGRVVDGEIHFFTKRENLNLRQLPPFTPQFMLGGSLECLALTAAYLRLDITQLEVIGGLDMVAYQRKYQRLVERGAIAELDGIPQLTKLGAQLEKLPVDTGWGELIVGAKDFENNDLLRMVCLAASAGQLYGITGRNWSKQDSNVVAGSDHLTCYNILAEVIRLFGKRVKNASTYYKLCDKIEGQTLWEWCKKRQYNYKEIKNALALFCSIYNRLGISPPPPARFTEVSSGDWLHNLFMECLARWQSLDFTYRNSSSQYPEKIWGNDRSGVSTGRNTLGTLRRWTDKNGREQCSIEGTDIPLSVIAYYSKCIVVECLAMTPEGTQVTALCELHFAGEKFRTIVNLPSDEIPPDEDLAWLLAKSFAAASAKVEDDELQMVISRNYQAYQDTTKLRNSEVKVPDLQTWYHQKLQGVRSVSEIKSPVDLLHPVVGELETLRHQQSEQSEEYKQLSNAVSALKSEIQQFMNSLPQMPKNLRERLALNSYTVPVKTLSAMEEWLLRVRKVFAEVQNALPLMASDVSK